MAHVNVLSLLCLVLLCGAATARSMVDTNPVTAEPGEELLAGEGHERQLKQSGTPVSGAFEVQVNPGVPCNDFPRDAGTAPNLQFRQGVQDAARFVVQAACGFKQGYKYIAQLSTKCRVDPKTKLARSIYIEYTSINFADIGDIDNSLRDCFEYNMHGQFAWGDYANYNVNQPLPAEYANWRITAPLHP